MKIKIPQTTIAKSRVQRVTVGEVKIGPIQVERLTLNNVHVQSSTGIAQMRNVHLALTLVFGLDWRVGVTISMPDGIPDVDFSDSGTLDLGTLTLGIGLGDLTLPGLASLAFDVSNLAVNDLTAVVGPLKNLNLGAALAERIRAQNLVAPGNGFTIAGLGVTGISATGISVPDAAVAAATIGRVSGGVLPISGFTIPSVELPQVMIPSLSSQNVDATSNPVVSTMPTVDVGLLAATLKVTTTAAFHLDELRIDNVQAATSIGEITLKNVVLPYEILDITLSQIGIESIEVPQAEVN
ncbi:MAG: hypothetical protein ACXWHG_12105 [Thermoanaerobaculia bacterium]